MPIAYWGSFISFRKVLAFFLGCKGEDVMGVVGNDVTFFKMVQHISIHAASLINCEDMLGMGGGGGVRQILRLLF